MNEENLTPFRSVSEAREKGRKGGKASGAARRRRKALKESMNALLELPVSNKQDFNAAVKMGIPLEDLDNSQLIVLALFKKAKEGDIAAIKELRSLIGEDKEEKENVVVRLEGEAEEFAN